jgi:CBS domain-containing protein
MTPNPQTIASNRPIGWAATLMTRHGIGRLPVCDDGRLLGIVTRGDLARHQIPNTLPGLLVRLAEHTTTRDDSERLDQPGDLLAMLENLQDTRRALLDLEVDLLERRRQLTARLRAPAASDRQRRTLRLVADVAVEPLGSIRPTDPR